MAIPIYTVLPYCVIALHRELTINMYTGKNNVILPPNIVILVAFLLYVITQVMIMSEIITFWLKYFKCMHMHYITLCMRNIFQLPIHCEVGQDPGPTPNDMPSSVPTQHSSAVVGPETTSPVQLG